LANFEQFAFPCAKMVVGEDILTKLAIFVCRRVFAGPSWSKVGQDAQDCRWNLANFGQFAFLQPSWSSRRYP
jgi:hypothetical protein